MVESAPPPRSELFQTGETAWNENDAECLGYGDAPDAGLRQRNRRAEVTFLDRGSPHWMHFELSRCKTRSDRTTSTAFRPVASEQNWHPAEIVLERRENEHLRAENPRSPGRGSKHYGRICDKFAIHPDADKDGCANEGIAARRKHG